MVAAFAGFAVGRVPGLQELGVGLALAVFLDATLVRIVLVPSLMAILGRWNWWLPADAEERRERGGPAPLSRPIPFAYATTLIASRKAGSR